MCPKKSFLLFPIFHCVEFLHTSFIHRKQNFFRTTRNIIKTNPYLFSGQLLSRIIQLSFITLIFDWKRKLSFRSRVLLVIMGWHHDIIFDKRNKTVVKPELGLLFLAFALVICFIHQFPEHTPFEFKTPTFPIVCVKGFCWKKPFDLTNWP